MSQTFTLQRNGIEINVTFCSQKKNNSEVFSWPTYSNNVSIIYNFFIFYSIEYSVIMN